MASQSSRRAATPRAITTSRASTPVSGVWNEGRLRSRQKSEAPMLSPTKVTRSTNRKSASNRILQSPSIAESVAPSVAGSDHGSNTGNGSLNARLGIPGNSYGTAVDAKSSQMASGNASNDFTDDMAKQLAIDKAREQSAREQVQAWVKRTAGQRRYGLSNEGLPDHSNQNLPPVREESEELNISKSFGPRHEHGMGQTDSRKKSFSIEHEHGIAKSMVRRFSREHIIQSREVSPDQFRDSFSPQIERQSPFWTEWDEARFWYNDHKNTIKSILGLLGLLVFGWFYGAALWNNACQSTSPSMLPDGAILPAVTVTSHVHQTTTVTEIIKETSAIALHPSIQERRNFFNMEVGATIDPRLTSITRAPMNKFYSVLAPISGKWFPGPIVNQADTALRPWTETGQSWCAASSDLGQGQMQLGISLPFTVRPLAVTLEHQLEHLSFNPSNSPRHVELWIDSHEDSTGANPVNDCGPRPEGLGDFWFCVAKMEFSRFNGEEKSQRIEFRNEHVFTKHFTFRVLDNWGSDHTCLYRVQMHGEMKRKSEDGAGA